MAKKEESKEVTTTTGTELMAPTLDDWGNDNEMSSNDLVIPKILVQQGLSKFVTDGVAMFGDFCDSLTGEVFGNPKKPIRFIPIYMQKIWVISEKIAGKERPEFRAIVPVTPENENWPWDYEENGKQFIRSFVRNFYALLPDAKKGMCYIIPFKGKSARAGKILATQMYTTNKLAGLPPAGTIMELSAQKEQNDDGVFMVQYVKPLEMTPAALVVEGLNWFKLIRAGKTVEDTSDYETEGTVHADASSPF
jgi:hypothetical protein